jgi:translation initiation factor 2 subunit 2
MIKDFMTLVDEAYSKLEKESKLTNIILPNFNIEISTTRIHWKNVVEILNTINRSEDHFMSFIKCEFVNKEIAWYSANKSDGLIIHGKYKKKNEITNIVNKYINNYVICSSCKSYNTLLHKHSNKQYEFECVHCGCKKIMIIGL